MIEHGELARLVRGFEHDGLKPECRGKPVCVCGIQVSILIEQSDSPRALPGFDYQLEGPGVQPSPPLFDQLKHGDLIERSGMLLAQLELNLEAAAVRRGDNIRRLSPREIYGKVGLVFQNPDDQLFSPTVFEDVAFGPLHMGLSEAGVRQRVERSLEAVQMTAYRDRLSHHLSVGEKKRIAIATVLSMDPSILVLDEPTAGLDPRSRRKLITLLRELPITMLVSTHDMAMVRELFPRTIIMDEGCIVADDLTVNLLQDESLLRAHGLEMP